MNEQDFSLVNFFQDDILAGCLLNFQTMKKCIPSKDKIEISWFRKLCACNMCFDCSLRKNPTYVVITKKESSEGFSWIACCIEQCRLNQWPDLVFFHRCFKNHEILLDSHDQNTILTFQKTDENLYVYETEEFWAKQVLKE